MSRKRTATDSHYFGEPWPSGICDVGSQVPTPVGESCPLCQELIGPGDQGSFMEAQLGRVPAHRECLLRETVGGIEHLTAGPHATGECYVGSILTYRQSALAAWDWMQTTAAHPLSSH